MILFFPKRASRNTKIEGSTIIRRFFLDFLFFFSWFSQFSVPADTIFGRWRHTDVTMTSHEIFFPSIHLGDSRFVISLIRCAHSQNKVLRVIVVYKALLYKPVDKNLSYSCTSIFSLLFSKTKPKICLWSFHFQKKGRFDEMHIFWVGKLFKIEIMRYLDFGIC